MLWVIGGIVVGVLLGAVAVYSWFEHQIGSKISQAWGLHYKPWWKFWKS